MKEPELQLESDSVAAPVDSKESGFVAFPRETDLGTDLPEIGACVESDRHAPVDCSQFAAPYQTT